MAVLLRGRALAAGTGGDGWQVLARLSTRAEVCPAFTGPHERTLAVLTPRSTTEAMVIRRANPRAGRHRRPGQGGQTERHAPGRHGPGTTSQPRRESNRTHLRLSPQRACARQSRHLRTG
jgi:hypothetical protein